jgi:hypothetical protein
VSTSHSHTYRLFRLTQHFSCYFQPLHVPIETDYHQAFFYKILKIKLKGFLFERFLKNRFTLILRLCKTSHVSLLSSVSSRKYRDCKSHYPTIASFPILPQSPFIYHLSFREIKKVVKYTMRRNSMPKLLQKKWGTETKIYYSFQSRDPSKWVWLSLEIKKNHWSVLKKLYLLPI